MPQRVSPKFYSCSYAAPGDAHNCIDCVEHIAAATSPGVPVRELLIRETEGSELLVLLEGEAPLSGCVTAFPTEIVFPQTQRGQTGRRHLRAKERFSLVKLC